MKPEVFSQINSVADLKELKDVYGKALMDFHMGTFEPPLMVHNTYGDPEKMPIEVFFRSADELSELDRYALHLCHGKVLDVGAGVGVHSLVLQEMHKEVIAIEASPLACEIMKVRGVKQIENKDIFNYEAAESFDTLLILMNGTGLMGTVNNFTNSLVKLRSLLTKNGSIIIDSSDISYLYDGFPKPRVYFGEVRYRFEYKNELGEWFPWLYLDQKKLQQLSKKAGFEAQIVFEDEDDQYLAVLKMMDT